MNSLFNVFLWEIESQIHIHKIWNLYVQAVMDGQNSQEYFQFLTGPIKKYGHF